MVINLYKKLLVLPLSGVLISVFKSIQVVIKLYKELLVLSPAVVCLNRAQWLSSEIKNYLSLIPTAVCVNLAQWVIK